MHCDLCNRNITQAEVRIVPLLVMQRAVRDGFNPFGTPSIDLTDMTELSNRIMPGIQLSMDEQYQGWRAEVMQDSTDWRLCPDCASAFCNAMGITLEDSSFRDALVRAYIAGDDRAVADSLIAEVYEKAGLIPPDIARIREPERQQESLGAALARTEPLRIKRSADKCYFCQNESPEEAHAVVVHMFSAAKRQRAEISVPRCRSCTRAHLECKLAAGLGSLMFLFSLMAFVFSKGWWSDYIEGEPLVFTLFGAGVLAVSLGVAYLTFAIRQAWMRGRRAEDWQYGFPAVTECRHQGWDFGLGPSKGPARNPNPNPAKLGERLAEWEPFGQRIRNRQVFLTLPILWLAMFLVVQFPIPVAGFAIGVPAAIQGFHRVGLLSTTRAIGRLQNSSVGIREAARVRRLSTLLAALEPADKQATEAVIKASRDHTRLVRLVAMQALIRIAPEIAEAKLIAKLESSADAEAADMLAQCGHGRRAVSALERVLATGTEPARRAAIRALSRIAPATAVSILIKQLSEPEKESSAATLLAQMGIAARPAIPALEKATDGWAKVALARVAPEIGVPRLIDELVGSQSQISRSTAALLLGESGPAAREAITALEKATKDPDETMRIVAERSLAQVTPETSVPKLIERLDSSDSSLRKQAAETLLAIGMPARQAIPALEMAIRDINEDVGAVAVDALAKVASQAIWDSYDDVGANAVDALADVASQVAVQKLADALDLPLQYTNVCWHIVKKLGQLGPSAWQAIPALQRAARNETPRLQQEEVRKAAMEALVQVSQEVAMPMLVERLWDPLDTVRKKAAEMLRDMGPTARWAASALKGAKRDHREDAGPVMEALAKVAPDLAVKELVEWLADSDVGTRKDAAERLGDLGSVARSAAPALEKATHDQDSGLRSTALWALVEVAPAVAVPRVGELLGDSSVEVRRTAVSIVSKLGANARQVTSALEKATRDNDGQVRDEAIVALGRVAPEIEVPEIIKRLEHPSDPDERRLALFDLKTLGPVARQAVPALERATDDQDRLVRLLSSEALATVAPDIGFPKLLDRLRDSDWFVRQQSAGILGDSKGDPHKEQTLAALEKATHDTDWGVREAATKAIEAIRKGVQ
jgi:HEAT repeat protein